jgi:perosamine synthetase
MNNPFIPQMEPWFGSEEKEALNQYMEEGGWLTEFKRTAEFEKRIAEYTGAKHCIVVNNGTISLTLIALAAGIKASDEVIVPNYTMIATPNSVKMFGAVPVFADVERETLCMDIDCAQNAITSRTRAIFIVTANGRYPKKGIESFQKLCDKNGLLLLEDAAQSLGSCYPNGKHQGTVGLAGSFSFSAPKIISTGQGGAIVTNDDEMYFRLIRLKDFGRSSGGRDIHDSIGFNFKFTELQAVIGNEQMKKLPWRIERKKEILRLYKNNLSDVNEVHFFDQDLKFTTPWFIDIFAENRDELMNHLKDHHIGTRMMYPPINKQRAYNAEGNYPHSYLVGEKGLWLPSASQLTNDQIDMVCQRIREFYNKKWPIKLINNG